MNQVDLNDRELSLMIELLEQERTELPAEIHHTDSPRVHDELLAREVLVRALLARLSDVRDLRQRAIRTD